MKTSKISKLFLLLPALLMLGSLDSCTKWQSWSPIYDTKAKLDTTGPIITSILPSDGMAGYREITITGRNFPADTDSVIVFFQDKNPVIKSMSPTQIVVYRPLMGANQYGVSLRVVVENPFVVETVDTVPYQLEAPVAQFCDLHSEPLPLGVMDFDKDGYLYSASAGNKALFQITPNGSSWSRLLDRTKMANSELQTITDMKFGPGGYLYCEVGSGDIFRLDVVNKTVVSSPFETLPGEAGNVSKFDWDPSGKFYTSGDQGLFLADTNGNATSTGHYGGGTTVSELRVIGGNLYVAHGSILSKNLINVDGSLGSDVTVIDVNTIPGITSGTITSFNLDVNGTVYLSVSYTSQSSSKYSIFEVQGQTVFPFYQDPAMLPTSVDQLLWSNNSRYLYLNRSISGVATDSATGIIGNYRLYKMGTLQNGAPYTGRSF